jgi:Ferritin-like domain
MDFRNILQEIEQTDPEVYERLSPRRSVLKSFGAKVAVAALPFAIGSLFKKAYGKTTTTTVIDVLNYALQREYFEYALYRTANNTGGLIPATDLPGFKLIEANELAHITFLNTTITALGGTPYTPNHFSDPTTEGFYVPSAYDFTGGTAYGTFDDYPTFLMLASVFEDLGIRAHGGQFQYLLGNPVLVQAQQMVATEGRHASFVRLIRRLAPINAMEIPAPWINNNIPPTPALQPFYLDEDNTKQMNIVITSLPGNTGNIPELSATAAFDEPMDKTTVLGLLAPFILP